MLKRFLFLLVTVHLAGCFPATREALKESAAQKWDFEIQEDYRVVYRRLAPLFRQCLEAAWIGDQVTARTELHADVGRADLAIEGINMLLGRRLQLLVELEEKSAGATRARVYEPLSPRPSEFVRRWATGSLSSCN